MTNETLETNDEPETGLDGNTAKQIEYIEKDFFGAQMDGLEGLRITGYVSFPETATIKSIKDFAEQAELMLNELASDSFNAN